MILYVILGMKASENLVFSLIFNMHIINVVLRSVKKYLSQSPEKQSPAADLPRALQSLFPSTPDYTTCGIYNHICKPANHAISQMFMITDTCIGQIFIFLFRTGDTRIHIQLYLPSLISSSSLSYSACSDSHSFFYFGPHR